MIPSRPDLSTPPGAPGPGLLTQPGAALRAGGRESAGLDFAGVLEANMPDAAALPQADNAAPIAAVFLPILPPVTDAGAMLPMSPATGGRILPQSGAGLPPLAHPVNKPDASPLTVPVMRHMPVMVGAAAKPTQPEALPDPVPDSVPDSVPDPFLADLPQAEASTEPPATLITQITAPPEIPQTALLSLPHALSAVPQPAQPAALPATHAVLRAMPRPVAVPVRAELAAMPEAAVLPDLPFDHASATSPDAASAPAPEPAPIPATPLAEAGPAPASANPPAATPAPVAPVPATIPVPPAERAETRAPAANQESAIAQVGEIREALRSARPEMTVRHAEFGFVSLRVEAAGTDGWRATLGSRDPGFVPAIHAALTDRAITASADTAGTNTGQNGTSDHRYGSSPNGGQGSSQPYLGQSLGQSLGREQGGEHSGSGHPQHQRQPGTTGEVASRASAAEADRLDRGESGVFA